MAEPAELEKDPAGVVMMLMTCACAAAAKSSETMEQARKWQGFHGGDAPDLLLMRSRAFECAADSAASGIIVQTRKKLQYKRRHGARLRSRPARRRQVALAGVRQESREELKCVRLK